MILRQSHFVPPVSYLLAAELGFLRGVEVLPTRTPSSAEQLRALLAGEQDMVVTAIDNLFEWTRAGADVRLVAQVEQTTQLGIHAGGDVESLADLAGCRFAVDAPDNGFALIAKHLLRDAGVEVDYVAGYTIVNDITARTLVPRNDIAMMGTDWFRAKNQPTFFPTGPYVVPKRFVPDPAKLRIRLSLNGTLMQDALADDLLFDIPSLIAYASSVAVLLPGDVLITGSPAGNGSHWGRYLRDGDVMEAEISGLGIQRSTVRGPSGQLPPWYVDRPDAVAAAGGAAP